MSFLKPRGFIVGLAVLVLLASCTAPNKEPQTKRYFDLRGLVENQIKILNKTKPMLAKRVIADNQNNTKASRDIDWAKELETILQADINKPAYAQSYEIDSTATDWQYTLKKGENLPVKSLHIAFQGRYKHVKAQFITSNFLYYSERYAEIWLKNDVLVSYTFDGYQQLFFGGKKAFSIDGQMVGQ
jgi:hypothetical protein